MGHLTRKNSSHSWLIAHASTAERSSPRVKQPRPMRVRIPNVAVRRKIWTMALEVGLKATITARIESCVTLFRLCWPHRTDPCPPLRSVSLEELPKPGQSRDGGIASKPRPDRDPRRQGARRDGGAPSQGLRRATPVPRSAPVKPPAGPKSSRSAPPRSSEERAATGKALVDEKLAERRAAAEQRALWLASPVRPPDPDRAVASRPTSTAGPWKRPPCRRAAAPRSSSLQPLWRPSALTRIRKPDRLVTFRKSGEGTAGGSAAARFLRRR